MSEKILEVKHLGKAFGSNQVLRDIDFSVSPGDVTCIIGPSGSGKSTLLRCLNMLETPSTGEINYHGTDITSKNVNVPEYRSKVGMVFQNFNLFNNMTALKNCTVGQVKVLKKSKEEAEKKALYYLEKVGMAPYINAKPKQLSGGQKQRVAIARAIINRPKVLLLDEPLGALDLKLRKQMQIELKRLQKKLGITFVYVTHDQEEALTMSDRIAIINQGRIEQLAAPKDIYEHPKTKFVASFIGETNLLDAMVLSIDGDKAVIGTEVGKATVMIDPKKKIKVSDGVAVSIRPENMKFSKTPVEGFSIKGVVKEQIFVGNLIKMMITLNDGTEIRINRFDADDLAENGELLYLYWDLQKGVVIKEKNLVDTDSVRDIEGGDPDEEE